MDELRRSKLFWLQLVTVVAAVAFAWTDDWFDAVVVFALAGLVLLTVLVSVLVLHDLDLVPDSRIRLTTRGWTVLGTLVALVVLVPVLIGWSQSHRADGSFGHGGHGGTFDLVEIGTVAEPTCWHPPLLSEGLPPCSWTE